MARNKHRPPKGDGEPLMEWYAKSRMQSSDDPINADVARSCASKQQYASDAEARSIATMNGMSGSLFTYHCRYCDFWHLTRRPTAQNEVIDE